MGLLCSRFSNYSNFCDVCNRWKREERKLDNLTASGFDLFAIDSDDDESLPMMMKDEALSMSNDYEDIYYERKLIETYIDECRQHHSAERMGDPLSSPKFLIAQRDAGGDEPYFTYGNLNDELEQPKVCELKCYFAVPTLRRYQLLFLSLSTSL